MSAHSEFAHPPAAIAADGTPASLGYRMPAEWEPHEATWLSWPRADGISFPGSYNKIVPTLAAMVQALAQSERVFVNVCDAGHEALVREHLAASQVKTDHVTFFRIRTNEPWCRDHGPIYLTRAEAPRMAIVDWDYNAWGGKYPPFDLDDDVPKRIAEHQNLPIYFPKMVLEGGSIDVNGAGTLLTTTSCLLNPNRNPDLSKSDIEGRIRDYLGVHHILWLGDGIEGDDTDGHVDDITRFIGPSTVLTMVEGDESDANHAPLKANLEALKTMRTQDGTPLEVLTMPMPRKIMRDGQRLPASYANFYIANRVVLLPVFADPNDEAAIAVLQKVFPERTIVPIDCRELIWGLGAFHCLTQQQPRLP